MSAMLRLDAAKITAVRRSAAASRRSTGVAGIGLRQEDTDLKAKIDRAIHDMVKDGTYKRLASKYFDFDIYGG